MQADAIITALEEQVGCYRRLAKLAQVQHEHVQQNQTEELLNVLQRRQEVLDGLARLEAIIGPAKRRWSDYLGELDAQRRAAAEKLLAETRKLLEEITAGDQHDALVLQQRKLNVGKQIHQAQAARQINRNYAASAYGKPKGRVDLGG